MNQPGRRGEGPAIFYELSDKLAELRLLHDLGLNVENASLIVGNGDYGLCAISLGALEREAGGD